MLYRVTALAIFGALAIGHAAAADWGTLKGRFVFDGPPPAGATLDVNKDLECCKVKHKDESLVVSPDGGIANVVVYLKTDLKKAKLGVHPDYDASADDQVVLDNHTCRFEPHVLAMRTSQKLLVKNTDDCSHNTNISPLGGGGINPLIPAGGDIEHKFNRQQNLPVPVACNIHPWMKAYVLPRENPYFAVTDADGNFEIKNVPAGADLEFQIWQESSGYVTGEVGKLKIEKGKLTYKLKPGDNDLGTIKLKPAIFKK